MTDYTIGIAAGKFFSLTYWQYDEITVTVFWFIGPTGPGQIPFPSVCSFAWCVLRRMSSANLPQATNFTRALRMLSFDFHSTRKLELLVEVRSVRATRATSLLVWIILLRNYFLFEFRA